MKSKTLKNKIFTNRLLTKEEFSWLDADIPANIEVFECVLCTYGCVGEFAATFDPQGGYPFFEIPYSAITYK